jgi:hypothetical protein
MDVPAQQRPPAGSLYLDHIAHFVPNLDAAAKLLRALGFAATPVSDHMVAGKPAGTSNRCVMLEQGYLEILAPTLDTPNAQRVRERMARYEGVHLVCYGTPAAPAEHARLAAHRFQPEPLVELRRKIDGGKEAGFRVVYVPPEKMPECRAQYCEHLTPELVWGKHYQGHQNGVIGLAAAYIVADDPAATAARWAEFSGLLPFSSGDGVALKAARGTIHIAARKTLSGFIDNVPSAPGVAAIGLKFRDPEAFAERCRKAGLKVKKSARGNCVSLPPALGGAWLF